MIHFSKYVRLYILISAIVIIPGLVSLFLFGLKPAIDFTGGSLIEYRFEKNIPVETVKEVVEEQKIPLLSAQSSRDDSFLLKTSPLNQDQVSVLQNALAEKSGGAVTELRFETIGPILGKELLQKTITAVAVSILIILLYIGWSFKNITFGISAVLALMHDLLVLIGSFSLLGHFFGVEVDSLFVTAVLTAISFSVHDTIVVCHRILEIQKVNPRLSIKEASDLALSETMVRSLNNSFTIIFMLLALVLLGGVSIRWFAVALLIGTVTGTYSSPFVATPLLVFFSTRRRSNK